MYGESWKYCLKSIEQLVQDSARTGDVQAEKPVARSEGADKRSSAPTSPNDAGNDANSGPFPV